MKLRENCWLWGHPAGAYNNAWGNEQPSRMTPMEACLYLGIRNTFMIGGSDKRRQYNKAFKTLRQVGWEFGRAFHAAKSNDDSTINEFFDGARDFPNVTTAVFDDFQNGGDYLEISPETYRSFHEKFHNSPIRRFDTWMVLYTNEFGKEEEKDKAFMEYIEPFDGIIMWTWEEKDVPLIPEKYEIFKKMTPNNRRMFGCYLWNFGEKKPATAKAVKWQLDWYLEKIKAGEAEGIVFHTNTMADLDLEAYDAAIEWLEEHGDDEIPFEIK